MKKHSLLAACTLAALVLVPVVASAQVPDSAKKDTAAVRPAPPPSQDQSRPQAARPAGAISDSAIIAMLVLSHTQEIAAADEALQRAQSDRVKRFAETLKNDHSKALGELEAFAERLGGMSSGVRNDSTAKATPPDSGAQKPAEVPVTPPDSSRGVAGHEFDHGFVRGQVQHHETEINHLRNDVIPMIKNSDLKALVQGELPIMGRHLTMARELEAFLKTTN